MSHQSTTVKHVTNDNNLRTSAPDLRASAFFKVSKGAWWLRIITLILVDCFVLFLAWTLTQYQAFPVDVAGYAPRNYIPKLILIQIGALFLQGTYQSGKQRYDYFNIIKTLTFAHGLILFISILYQPIIEVTKFILTVSWLLCTTLVITSRFVVEVTLKYLRQRKILGCNSVFIICEPEHHEQVINFIKNEKRYIIRGFDTATSLDRCNRENTLEKLNNLNITEVFIAGDAIKNRMFLCWLFQASGITVNILPMQLKPIHRQVYFQKIGGMPCLSVSCPTIIGRDFWIKRVFDFCFTSLFLISTFPIYLAIATAIKLDSPGPIFYKQMRIGLHGKPFQVWKFRTMRPDADKHQKELEALNETKDGIIFKIKDDPRITRIGKLLRRYSLDELPQLFNVLLGEMSLVGPRPLPTRDVDKFLDHHFLRQEVLPGVTGLWQVSGRSNILDFEQVINLDMSYIENWSLQLDFEILLKTVKVVLNKEGAY
ncbi:sugar transferase [Fortiea sp. LEGE XX443]|uniref:sugar transferase n=1 Tax=Fortiea sp. LEGE XX443 TaxID=1828611 RepID=UPI0018801317|nr:sugar transferase [Fortiea sp. LEGE XX443]MBE9007320.1 sugar transferase [Fortiea sp. LEGE XX443]